MDLNSSIPCFFTIGLLNFTQSFLHSLIKGKRRNNMKKSNVFYIIVLLVFCCFMTSACHHHRTGRNNGGPSYHENFNHGNHHRGHGRR